MSSRTQTFYFMSIVHLNSEQLQKISVNEQAKSFQNEKCLLKLFQYYVLNDKFIR